MTHLVLLGDSIFDNAAYVEEGPAVIDQVRDLLPENWQATLLAVDGDMTMHIPQQLERLPADASHLFVSVGGNNALHHSEIIGRSANSVAEVFTNLAQISDEFEQQYQDMLKPILAQKLPTTLCTIYNPSYEDPTMQRLLMVGLTIFNNVIIQCAVEHRLPLIDLRIVCNQPDDYANPIEPSSAGGAKIAKAVVEVAKQHSFEQPITTIYR